MCCFCSKKNSLLLIVGNSMLLFSENQVDAEAIRSLIPAIGPQAKFKRKLLIDWKLAQQVAVNEYGENASVDGLTPSLSSTIAPGSPAQSVSGSSTTSVTELYERNLEKLLSKTQDGQLLFRQRFQPLGDHLRKILTAQISKEILKSNPKAPVTYEMYIHWANEIGK